MTATMHEYTCLLCGRCDHSWRDCPAPTERERVGWLCTHGAVPEVIRDGLQCPDGDVPVYENDTVTITTRYGTPNVAVNDTDGVESMVTTHVTRGCRANNADGQPCRLHAGHQWWTNHGPGYDKKGHPVGPYWPVEPPRERGMK